MSAIGEMNQNVWTRKIAQRNDDGKRRSKRLSKYSRYIQARLLAQRVLDYQIGQRILWGADYSLSDLWSGKVLLRPEQKIAKFSEHSIRNFQLRENLEVCGGMSFPEAFPKPLRNDAPRLLRITSDSEVQKRQTASRMQLNGFHSALSFWGSKV